MSLMKLPKLSGNKKANDSHGLNQVGVEELIPDKFERT